MASWDVDNFRSEIEARARTLACEFYPDVATVDDTGAEVVDSQVGMREIASEVGSKVLSKLIAQGYVNPYYFLGVSATEREDN